jgi:putative transposase
VLSATISQQAGRWFCALSVETQRNDQPAARSEAIVGVDVGLRHFSGSIAGHS